MDEDTLHIISLIGSAIFAIVCSWVAIYNLLRLNKYIQASNWPVCSGTVHKSSVHVDESGDGIAYKPQISYSYNINGTSYTSSNVYMFTLWQSSSHATYLTNKYKEGDQVNVHVNPSNNNESTLITGFNRLHFNALSALIFFIVLGVLFTWAFISGIAK